MKTSEIFEILEANKNTSLLFEYAPGKLVGANYHITEVKHLKIDSVDCGAGTDAWNETIIQLWESPSERDKTEFMSSFKALEILNKVGSMRPYDMTAELKFEYGNEHFHTAQLFVKGYTIKNGDLKLILGVEKTDCKAKETCGIPELAVQNKLNNEIESCCTPGGGCC